MFFSFMELLLILQFLSPCRSYFISNLATTSYRTLAFLASTNRFTAPCFSYQPCVTAFIIIQTLSLSLPPPPILSYPLFHIINCTNVTLLHTLISTVVFQNRLNFYHKKTPFLYVLSLLFDCSPSLISNHVQCQTLQNARFFLEHHQNRVQKNFFFFIVLGYSDSAQQIDIT